MNAWRMAQRVNNRPTKHADSEQTRTNVHITEANGTHGLVLWRAWLRVGDEQPLWANC